VLPQKYNFTNSPINVGVLLIFAFFTKSFFVYLEQNWRDVEGCSRTGAMDLLELALLDQENVYQVIISIRLDSHTNLDKIKGKGGGQRSVQWLA
jgi:hypothetical protein